MASKDATRRAMITVGLNDRQLARDLDGASRQVRKWGGDVDRIGRRVSGAGRGKGRGGKGGFGLATVAGAVAGVTSTVANSITGFVASTVDDVFNFEMGLARLQIAAGKTAEETHKTRRAILDVSKATGIAAGEILSGTQTYVDLTGDIAGAEAAMSSFARIAQASGAKVSDVATATAALKESMGLDSRDIEAAFSGLIQQGKAGAVSLADLAAQLSAVAPRFAKFGGSGLLGIADLGAALQVVRKGFGSASEAATGLEALMGALSLNAGKFEAAGVKIFRTGKGGKKEFRGFVEIIDAIGRSRLVKDPTALTQAWGSKEAAQAFDMLVANRQELEKIYEAGKDAGAVTRDLATYLQSPAGRLEKAFNQMKVSIAEAMTPERIAKFARAMERVAGFVEKVSGFFDHMMADENFGADTDEGEKAGRMMAQQYVTSDKGRADYAKLDYSQRQELAKKHLARAAEMEAKGDRIEGGYSRALAKTLQADTWGAPAAAPERTWFGDMRAQIMDAMPAVAAAERERVAKEWGEALVRAIGELTINVKVDDSTLAKTVRESPANRQPPRGR